MAMALSLFVEQQEILMGQARLRGKGGDNDGKS